MTGATLTEAEKDWEASCRTLTCPNCGSRKPRACSLGVSKVGHRLRSRISHTGRYLAAVDAGLVPPFPGGWHG